MSVYRKKVEKVYRKIDTLALVGYDNKIEYFNYIDELINNGNYSYLEEALLYYYNYDIHDKRSVNSYKDESWDVICSKTTTNHLIQIANLYKSKSIYQISYGVYDINNQFLGEIYEKEVNSENYEYYLKNKNYARLIGEFRTYLLIKKPNMEDLLIDQTDTSKSEDQNLFERYKLAVDYLLNIN
jgi:hypothetical protein